MVDRVAPVQTWSDRVRTILATVLVVLGLLRVVGFVSGLFPLSVLGAQFGASPLPLVFSRVHGIDTYARRFAIEIDWADGRRERIAGDHRLAGRLGGPFTRLKLYLDEMAYADLSPSRRRREVLTAAFCHDGPVRRSLGINGRISSVAIELWTVGASDPVMRFSESCDP